MSSWWWTCGLKLGFNSMLKCCYYAPNMREGPSPLPHSLHGEHDNKHHDLYFWYELLWTEEVDYVCQAKKVILQQLILKAALCLVSNYPFGLLYILLHIDPTYWHFIKHFKSIKIFTVVDNHIMLMCAVRT